MAKQPYTYTHLNPVFDFENDPTAQARSAEYVGEDGTVTANHIGGGLYSVYYHDEVTPGGRLLIDGTLPGRVEDLEAQKIVSFNVIDNGDGTSTLEAVRNDASTTTIGTVDAAANDITSFVAVNDTLTITLADGTTLPATTDDNFSVSGTLNANTITVTRNDGGDFDIDVEELNETLTLDAAGVIGIFNDGTVGGNTAFRTGKRSPDVGNILEERPNGNFVPASTSLGFARFSMRVPDNVPWLFNTYLALDFFLLIQENPSSVLAIENDPLANGGLGLDRFRIKQTGLYEMIIDYNMVNLAVIGNETTFAQIAVNQTYPSDSGWAAGIPRHAPKGSVISGSGYNTDDGGSGTYHVTQNFDADDFFSFGFVKRSVGDIADIGVGTVNYISGLIRKLD